MVTHISEEPASFVFRIKEKITKEGNGERGNKIMKHEETGEIQKRIPVLVAYLVFKNRPKKVFSVEMIQRLKILFMFNV
jgi:hypothetical protein